MPKDPALVVGPMDADRVAGLVGRMGVHHNARRLLQRSASIFTPELVGALNKPPDDIRTEALLSHSDELARAAEKAKLPGKVVGASVRGGADVSDEDRVVVLTLLPESGRSYRAVLNYGKAKLDGAKDTAKNLRRMRLGIEATAIRLAQGNDAATQQSPGAVTAEEAAELRAYIRELESQGGQPAEPFEGYSDASVEQVEEAIAGVDPGFEQELLKRRVREAEEARGDKARKGVLEATEPVELVPASDGD